MEDTAVKKKAKDLVEKFGDIGIYISEPRDFDISINQTSDALETKKQCAIIAVDEIIQAMDNVMLPNPFKQYWNKVKQEIQAI